MKDLLRRKKARKRIKWKQEHPPQALPPMKTIQWKQANELCVIFVFLWMLFNCKRKIEFSLLIQHIHKCLLFPPLLQQHFLPHVTCRDINCCAYKKLFLLLSPEFNLLCSIPGRFSKGCKAFHSPFAFFSFGFFNSLSFSAFVAAI